MQYDVLCAHGDDWFLWGRPRPRHLHTFHGSCAAEMLHATRFVYRVKMACWAMFEYATCLLADELITVSSVTRRFIPWIKHVIPCGVNTEAFRPGDKKSDRPSILFVGTMLGRKRGAMLVEKFTNEIRKAVPDAELWCVCEESVEAPGVKWFGRVPLETLTALYRNAWAFCLPSTYEGFGVPYIEAMSAGTPVIASPNDGAVEVTGNGQYGIVCDDDALSTHLISVLTDERLRDDLRARGLKRAQDFSWSRVCEMYEELFTTTSKTSVEPAQVSA